MILAAGFSQLTFSTTLIQNEWEFTSHSFLRDAFQLHSIVHMFSHASGACVRHLTYSEYSYFNKKLLPIIKSGCLELQFNMLYFSNRYY